MRNLTTIIISAILFLALLAYSVAYTVRFTETAVLTTFGKAGPGDVKDEAGLNLKWPYPIQSVTKYDRRLRVLNIKMEQVQTRDNKQIVVEAFCLWRVDDALKFFQSFGNSGDRPEDHYNEAEKALRGNLRQALGMVSQYRMDQLFVSREGGGELDKLEQDMLAAFSAGGEATNLSNYGIVAVDVGITRLVLPEETTRAVFDRMQANRQAIAQATESQGLAQASAIRSKAESDANRIIAFTERLAQDIRTRGDVEVQPYLAAMNKQPELAVFLANMEFLRQIMPKHGTLALPTSLPGMQVFRPDALNGLSAGELPRMPFVNEVASPKPVMPSGGAGTPVSTNQGVNP